MISIYGCKSVILSTKLEILPSLWWSAIVTMCTVVLYLWDFQKRIEDNVIFYFDELLPKAVEYDNNVPILLKTVEWVCQIQSYE